jgi:hypothetical protein
MVYDAAALAGWLRGPTGSALAPAPVSSSSSATPPPVMYENDQGGIGNGPEIALLCCNTCTHSI